MVEFHDVLCSQNAAGEDGGCFFIAGRGTVTNATTMQNNVAEQGGCICEYHVATSVSIETQGEPPCTSGGVDGSRQAGHVVVLSRFALCERAHNHNGLGNL